MTEQTDPFNEHAHGAELANQDEAEAVAARRQAVEDAALYAVALLAAVVIFAVIVFGK